MYVEVKDINKTYAGYQASNHVSFGIGQADCAVRTERQW